MKVNRKLLAVLIVVIVIAGSYIGYYSYANSVLIPKDLQNIKEDLKDTSTPTFTDNEISEIESEANIIEQQDTLSLIPQSTRNGIADNITNAKGNLKYELSNITRNFTDNRDMAQKYDLIFRGDVAKDIRLAYDPKFIDLTNELLANMDKEATDIRNGDTSAYVKDLRELANLMREFNSQEQQAHQYLQEDVNKLGG